MESQWKEQETLCNSSVIVKESFLYWHYGTYIGAIFTEHSRQLSYLCGNHLHPNP